MDFVVTQSGESFDRRKEEISGVRWIVKEVVGNILWIKVVYG